MTVAATAIANEFEKEKSVDVDEQRKLVTGILIGMRAAAALSPQQLELPAADPGPAVAPVVDGMIDAMQNQAGE